MRIGLVLGAIPGYSETFFRNKVRLLQETEGFEVVLLVDREVSGLEWTISDIVHSVQVSGASWRSGFVVGYYFLKAWLSQPVKVFKLLLLNRRSGFGIQTNIQSVIRSLHIVSQKLDWLHFGFGTMAIGRENVAQVIGAKMAVSFRGFDHYIFPIKFPGCYNHVFQNATKIHVLSQGMKKGLVHQGVRQDRIHVITPAINTDDFQPTLLKDRPQNRVRITTVARLHWIKGLEYTLDALSLLKQRGIDFHYSIVGEGDDRERLLFAIHQLGLNSHVTLMGKLKHAEVTELLRQTDIYVQYSIQEGFCNAVLEAQAMGLLCVVSDAEGLVENIIHEQTGWVVCKRSPIALAKKIEEIIKMELADIDSIRRNTLIRIMNYFTLQVQKNQFLKFYD